MSRLGGFGINIYIDRGRERERSVYLPDAGIVNEAGIGTGASDDDLGPEQPGSRIQLVVVYETCHRLERERGSERFSEHHHKNTRANGRKGEAMPANRR